MKLRAGTHGDDMWPLCRDHDVAAITYQAIFNTDLTLLRQSDLDPGVMTAARSSMFRFAWNIKGMVIPKLIYLDTNLWNRLLDQNVDPISLISGLERCNSSLALSGQTVYELTQTFRTSAERGKKLFRYLKICVDAGIVGAYDNMDLLRSEVKALYERADSVVAYYSPADYDALKVEVAKLAEGVVDERAQSFLSERREFARASREGQKAHMENRPDMKTRLLAVSEDGLAAWLDEQVSGDVGAALLTGHLVRVYESPLTDKAISTALGLLQHPAPRTAKALVRADLYSNWRCARRGSNPRDLMDDMYHVLNATYCDVYATAEAGQKEYAALLLSRWTRPAIYDGSTPLKDWLLIV